MPEDINGLIKLAEEEGFIIPKIFVFPINGDRVVHGYPQDVFDFLQFVLQQPGGRALHDDLLTLKTRSHDFNKSIVFWCYELKEEDEVIALAGWLEEQGYLD